MIHRVAYVAESRRLPEKELVAFAVANHDKYGIIDHDKAEPYVSTWYCDDLVRDFRKQSR